MSEEQTDTTLTPYRTPWTIHPVGRKDGALTVCTGDGGPAFGVAYVPNENDELTEEQQRLHARLITAAPELLEAAKQLLQVISAEAGTCAEVSPPVREQICSDARDAIAKAEGRDE